MIRDANRAGDVIAHTRALLRRSGGEKARLDVGEVIRDALMFVEPEALRHRVETGRWDSVAQPQALQASASALGLGGAAFVHYEPPALSGDNGSFDPATNGR